MSLDAIKQSIESEAQSKASAIDKDGSKEAKRIVDQAQAKAKEIMDNAKKDAQMEVERLRKESEAGAETEANSMTLQAKGEVVEKILKKISTQIEADLAKNHMKKILETGMKQFKEMSEAGKITIKTSKKNAPLLKNSNHQVEYADIDGFMLYSDNGRIALNATIGSIVEREKDGARKMIYEELFPVSARARKAATSTPKPKKAAKKMVKKPAKGKKKR